MKHLWACPLLLVAFLLGGCSGSSWHSLRYFSTIISEPDRDVSDFIAMGYVDDQLVGHYDRSRKRIVPQTSWGKKMEKGEPQIYGKISQRIKNNEFGMKEDLRNLQNLYNQSRGLYIMQRMISCELSKDGHKKGFYQFSYNGEDYLNFDQETLTWTAAIVPALVTKREWDADVAFCQLLKFFLEEECISWLQKFLDYGQESLLWREPPTVRVTLKASFDGLETLVCRAHGFHPKEIFATWRKDGEVLEQETFRGGVVPNSDGTYHTWLSIKIHPEDRFRYRCRVEHDGLPEPLDVAWEEPVSSKTGLIAGVLMGVVASILFVAGIICLLRKRRSSYQAARKAPPINDQEA
ncbi:major histocompatibility complex class I-related gene protein-like [Eublepharis macularius]|uniref:Major histocompatibility complex class I-related gene protein-like n=1 Tax=Eublepharis macularius TaxID=481883 RepID=A0AA97KV60_EUBMA|nr:major histocompatibility complex class I-related gene protein-like [Eublepharis macularius]